MANNSNYGYKVGEQVIYPTHGVGEVMGFESIESGGSEIKMIVIKFYHEKMTLRLPMDSLEGSGLRPVAGRSKMNSALNTLKKSKSRMKTSMWNRRAQEYMNKINSGDPVAVAEVLRDLFRRDDQPEQSYSEHQLYKSALSRLASELALVRQTSPDDASREVEEILGKNFNPDTVTDSGADANDSGDSGAEENSAGEGSAAETESESEPKPVSMSESDSTSVSVDSSMSADASVSKTKTKAKAKTKAKVRAKARSSN